MLYERDVSIHLTMITYNSHTNDVICGHISYQKNHHKRYSTHNYLCMFKCANAQQSTTCLKMMSKSYIASTENMHWWLWNLTRNTGQAAQLMCPEAEPKNYNNNIIAIT